MSTVIPEVQARDVLRCHHCSLVQFRTMSNMCRRCARPLPLPPRFEEPPQQASGAGRSGTYTGDRQSLQPRGKTARELTIGRKLRELREARNLTQQEMAGRAGVPRTYISRIENARLLPGPVMLRRIAEALSVEILDLLPQGKHLGEGDAPSMEDAHYWNTFVEHFRQLSPADMSFIASHVRSMVEEDRRFEYTPAIAVK